MLDKGLNKGLVQDFKTDKMGESKSFFGFRKMFWTYLNKLGVPFYDSCCTSASTSVGLMGIIPLAAQQALSGAGAINVTSYYTAWTTTGANAGTLADGTQAGQRKKIRMVVDAGDGVLTPAHASGFTTITFNDVADVVELIWNGTAWVVIENFGAVVA
jgi:hypothetical protein